MSATSGFFLVLLGFGFLIFIHELGHFLAAKWAGIRADGFAIGMGPCVASYRRGVGFCLGSADAKVVRAHGKRPIEMTDAERERYRQFQVSGYEVKSAREPAEGEYEQVVEIRVVNRHTQVEKIITDRQRWRWDPESKRWWLASGLPDLDAAR